MLFQLVLSLHIVAFVAWFAGLFYLPRLFVYHATTKERNVDAYFKTMEYKLYYYIMYPAMLLTLLSGGLLIILSPFFLHAHWLQIKLGLVFLLLLYHFSLGVYLNAFKHDQTPKSERFFRMYNEVPTVLLIMIVLLVILKPFGYS